MAAGWPLATLGRRGLRGRQRLHSAGMMPCHDLGPDDGYGRWVFLVSL